MNKKLAQLVALVTYANVSLQGYDLDVDPFITEYCYGVEFVQRPPREIAGAARIIASGAIKWYDYIKSRDAERVRLHNRPSSGTGLPDHISEAFTGGGSEWFVEVQLPEKSQLYLRGWVPYVGTVQNPWKTPFVQLSSDLNHLEDIAPSVNDSRNTLGAVLDNLIEFAGRFDHTKHWVANFQSSQEILTDYEPRTSDEFIPAGIYSKDAHQLIETAFGSLVFGGMGSWNDLAFGGEDQDVYKSLTEKLYEAVHQAVVSGVNSYP